MSEREYLPSPHTLSRLVTALFPFFPLWETVGVIVILILGHRGMKSEVPALLHSESEVTVSCAVKSECKMDMPSSFRQLSSKSSVPLNPPEKRAALVSWM